VGPCHNGMACPQVVDGGDGLQIWRVAMNILNKQLQRADKGWSYKLGVGIPMTLVGLMKISLNETYSKVCIGINLSDALPSQNGQKQ